MSRKANAAYNNFQKEYIELLVPVGNLQNEEAIDELLSQIECSIARRDGYTPSSRIFSILLTLSVESVTIDRHGTASIEGVIPPSSSYVEFTNRYNDSYNAPFHVRALGLLNQYLNFIVSQGKQSLNTYLEIKAVFVEFLALRGSKRGLRNVNKINYDVVHLFERILNEKLVESSQEDPRRQPEGDIDMVSDSEEELELITQPFMQSELKRFHQRASKSAIPTPPNGSMKASELFETMPHMETRSPTPGVETLNYVVKIFDEDLLLSKLDPVATLYGFWSLLEWCLNCNNWVIYNNYNKIIHWMIDFMIFDFQNCNILTRKLEEELKILLVGLLHQLSSKRRDWHDRLVEFTMLGLITHNRAHPCYKREKWWKSHSKQEQFESKLHQSQINADSIYLRTKIILLVYEYGESNSYNLVQLVAAKMSQLSIEMIRQFYSNYYLLLKVFPRELLNRFYLELSINLLRNYRIELPLDPPKAVETLLGLLSNKRAFKEYIRDTFLDSFLEESDKFRYLVDSTVQSIGRLMDIKKYTKRCQKAAKIMRLVFRELELKERALAN